MSYSIVRDNLMTREGYSPYCGGSYNVCRLPRTQFNGEQFECPGCDFVTNFPKEFIDEYKAKWKIP